MVKRKPLGRRCPRNGYSEHLWEAQIVALVETLLGVIQLVHTLQNG